MLVRGWPGPPAPGLGICGHGLCLLLLPSERRQPRGALGPRDIGEQAPELWGVWTAEPREKGSLTEALRPGLGGVGIQ